MSKGRLSISRTMNTGDDKIHIEITDELSGATFVRLKLSLADFALAVTGLSGVSGDMDLHGLQVLGKRREMKHEVVLLTNPHPKYEDVLELAKPFEVDDWKCHLYKGSRIEPTTDKKTGEHTLSVSFVRWVEVEDMSS